MKRLTPRVFPLSVTASLLAFGFSALGQIVPGDARLAGMYYIVPDVACWFSAAGNYVTNGYINTAVGQAASPADLGNWEPYTGVMGDTTFLIEFNTYANDGTLANQNFCVAQQPANGAAAKIAYAYYDDSGAPFKSQINLSRENGNPGRVAGDKRLGGTKYITEAECSIGQLAGFQSTARWANNNIYQGTDRYAGSQLFTLNPNTLATTPVTNAWDYVYGNYVGVMGANNNAPQCSRTGGRSDFLDNGDVVVMIDDKTSIVSPNGEVVTFAIIHPDGTIVKSATLADSSSTSIFDNMCAFAGGFCIRVGQYIYFYHNDGSLILSNNLTINATPNLQAAPPSGWGFSGTWDYGRGDAQHIGGDIRSPYVFMAGNVAVGTGSNACMMAVWNGPTGAFITNVMVSSDLDPAFLTVDRTSVAVDMSNRVCVAFDGIPDKTGGYANQVIGRVMQWTGTGVKYLCSSFFAFINSDNVISVSSNGVPAGFTTVDPNVSMTTKAICIAAKGSINSTNNPINSGPDSPVGNTTVYTVISMPLGGPDLAGLSYVQPDMICWWDSTGNFVTNGPVKTAEQGVPGSLGNWEPYAGVLGDSTFLVEFNTYANDGTLINQNMAIAKQPAAGGAPLLGYTFYDDSGAPFKGQINLSRENGNPGRVAGDLRYGATKYITECEVSIGQLAGFQSTARWGNNNIYAGTDRYAAEQIFNLNPTTLVSTPVTNAWEYVYGPFVGVMGGLNNAPQCSRTGGRPNFLDNGNIVVMIDDKTAIVDPAHNEVTTFAIIQPNGAVVKGPTEADPNSIWDNMCAFSGGFAIRVGPNLYFFDDNGNALHTNNVVTDSGISFDQGRGDGTRIGSDIRSHYVYLAGNVGSSDYVAIWNAQTFQLVTSARVCELDPNYTACDRTMIAVDGLDRFTVAYKLKPTGKADPGQFPQFQIAGRVGQFDGASITWLTPSFYPFVNHDAIGNTTVPPYETDEPTVAMTTRQICFAAKGTLNSTNNPAAVPDTQPETTVYAVVTHPAPVAAPRPTMTVTHSGNNVIISWNASAGLFTLVSSSNAAAPLSTWAAVSPQPATTGGPPAAQYSMTVPVGAGGLYFDLKR